MSPTQSDVSNETSEVNQNLSDLKDMETLLQPLRFVTAFKSPTQNDLSAEDTVNMHRGELSAQGQYQYNLSRAQLKATSNTSALLVGFAMIALIELHYEETTPHILLVTLGIVTTLLVSVHLIALMTSTCLLPHIDASGCTQDSPHLRLHFYIEMSWLFSTCIGLLLFFT